MATAHDRSESLLVYPMLLAAWLALLTLFLAVLLAGSFAGLAAVDVPDLSLRIYVRFRLIGLLALVLGGLGCLYLFARRSKDFPIAAKFYFWCFLGFQLLDLVFFSFLSGQLGLNPVSAGLIVIGVVQLVAGTLYLDRSAQISGLFGGRP